MIGFILVCRKKKVMNQIIFLLFNPTTSRKKTCHFKEQDCSVRSFWFLCLILYLPHYMQYSISTLGFSWLIFSFSFSPFPSFFFYIKEKQQQHVSPAYWFSGIIQNNFFAFYGIHVWRPKFLQISKERF